MTSSPLRIALFTYSTQPRGSVIHTIELAEALQRLGHDVCIYALDKQDKGFDRPLACKSQLVPAYPVVGDTDALIHQRIQEFVAYLGNGHLQNHSYDIYHAQDCISASALAELQQQKIIPHFVRTVHHIESFNSPYLQACQSRSILSPNLCLCVSQYWQIELQKQYRIAASRVINGVNTHRFSAQQTGDELAVNQKLGLSGNPIYLTVGGIEPRKNSIALLQAFQQVLAHLPTAQLVIAGGATLFDYQPYRDQFFAMVEQYGIAIGKSLILPGVVSDEDLPVLYRAADAFVFPSVQEGWGLVILEAIASGLPVITANQPPFTEFLTPEQALLIDPHSPQALAQAMLQITQPHVADRLIQQSRSICHNYSWETAAKLHLVHYFSLL